MKITKVYTRRGDKGQTSLESSIIEGDNPVHEHK